MMDAKGKVKKKSRKLPKSEDDDEGSPSPQSDQNPTNEASFDKLLRAAMKQTTDEKRKSGKKKGKRTKSETTDAMLESLKQGADLRKDTDPSEDPSILANTYDGSDSPRFHKNLTNEKGRKPPPKKGMENKGFIDDEDKDAQADSPKKTKKKKKKADASDIMDSGPLTMQELEDTPKKVRRKKKLATQQENDKDSEKTEQQQTGDEADGGDLGKEITEEGIEENEKAAGKKKKKKTASKDDKPDADENEGAKDNKKKTKKKRKRQPKDDGRVFGVNVHRSDRLKTDLYIAHPLVRVHIIDMDTGTYFKKSKLDRAVTSYYENQNDKVDYILPVLTQPFDFKKRKSIIPCWDEQLIFNESYNYLIQSDESAPKAIIFFEILDFVSMNITSTKSKMLKGEGGWHRIAWAFLKVVGANGIPNTDKKVRLQLFYPPFSYKGKPGQLDVYQWWQNISRQPYPSTLYVTVKAVKTPDKVEPAVRSLYATQEEQGRMSFSDLKKSINWGTKQAMGKEKPLTNWTRLPGQMCRIPNKLSLALAGDKKGCFVLKFSPSGRFLACGCKDREGYPVLVYEIPSGRFKCQFPGHYSLIYDISWAANDNEILTASSDGTARIWNLETPDSAAEKVFPHPAFVYTAKFHPQADHLVVSGGYDHVVRVWSKKNDSQTAELLQELDGHKGFVNCLCFSRDGKTMFSGDSVGVIIKWNAAVMAKAATSDRQVKFGSTSDSLESTGARPKELEQKLTGILKQRGAPDRWSVEKVINEKELEGVTINSLEVHPSGRRLLIHGRDNNLRMMDLRLFTVMQRYLGALNFREHVRSTMTECGSFVISGSEDQQAYVWNTDTGDQIAVYSNLGYKYPVMAVTYHPYEHMVAFCSRGEGHPIKVYVYDAKVARLDLGLKSASGAKEKEEVGPGVAKAEESLLNLLEAKRDLKDELDTTKTLRMERVKAKLATVMAFKKLAKGNQENAQEQQLQQSMLGNSFVLPPGGATPMQQTLSTWGSTFDASMFKPQSSFLANQSVRGVRSLGLSMGGTGWTPPRAYFPRASTPSIALQATRGGTATFTFNTPSSQKNRTNLRRVVALYDYTAQRSDELNLRQGDWISVLHEDNENWWMGQLENGQQGYFPANYVADEYFEEEQEVKYLGEIPGSTGAEETDSASTTPRRRGKTKFKKDGSKMTAVVTKSGELKILSAAEDSDLDITPATSQRRRKKKTLSRELAVDLSRNGSDIADEDTTPRRQRTRTRTSSAQRRLASSFDTVDVGIPPRSHKKRSKTVDDTVLSNEDLAGSSRTTSRLSKTMSQEELLAGSEDVKQRTPKPRKKHSKTAGNTLLSSEEQNSKTNPKISKTLSREQLLSGSEDIEPRTPKPRKKRSKTSEEATLSNGNTVGSSRKPELKSASQDGYLSGSQEEVEPRTPKEKKGGKRKQKMNHTERTV
ncbi:jouberin-like isoform X2 [Acanthaster planci]|uniref:Jouberin-like isoform X2 n=1 Tax=Acanthaster planci TaxID=133434 RepID=A0A8B7YAM7_ACAPL|nr:jouberin-like isoform X2 [Acanthaster planci]